MKDRFTKGNFYKIRVSKRVLNPETFSVHNRDIQRDHRFLLCMKMIRDNLTMKEMAKVFKITPVALNVWMNKYGVTASADFKKWQGKAGERISKGHAKGQRIAELNKRAKALVLAINWATAEINDAILEGKRNLSALRKARSKAETDYNETVNELRKLTA